MKTITLALSVSNQHSREVMGQLLLARALQERATVTLSQGISFEAFVLEVAGPAT
jgi:hypothetical protein